MGFDQTWLIFLPSVVYIFFLNKVLVNKAHCSIVILYLVHLVKYCAVIQWKPEIVWEENKPGLYSLFCPHCWLVLQDTIVCYFKQSSIVKSKQDFNLVKTQLNTNCLLRKLLVMASDRSCKLDFVPIDFFVGIIFFYK